jgi:negative regulator of flagellin synthesis FlgM
MKINAIAQSNMINAYNDTKKKITKSEEVTKKDSLEISAAARNLNSMSIDTIKENSASKIESIKNQVKQGTYNPSSRLVAQRMMAMINGSEV